MMAMNVLFKNTFPALLYNRHRDSRDRLVVRTLRCGRSNPGSNPGHGIFCTSTNATRGPSWQMFRQSVSAQVTQTVEDVAWLGDIAQW